MHTCLLYEAFYGSSGTMGEFADAKYWPKISHLENQVRSDHQRAGSHTHISDCKGVFLHQYT